MIRFASVVLAVVAAATTSRVAAQSNAALSRNTDFCAAIKQIAAAAPEQFKKFDAGEVRIGGGRLVMPDTRQSSATVPGSTTCRILTGASVSHACYFKALSAAGVVEQARDLARNVGQCVGQTTAARESLDGQYRVLSYTSGGVDYSVRVRPETTINVELNIRAATR